MSFKETHNILSEHEFHSINIYGTTSSQSGETGEVQACSDKRYAMVLFRITSVFYILWLPYIIYFLLESSTGHSNRFASFLTTWLAISNSFCNCVIYSLSNSVFQRGLKRLSGAMCTSCASQMVAKDPYTVRSKGPLNGFHVWSGSNIELLCVLCVCFLFIFLYL